MGGTASNYVVGEVTDGVKQGAKGGVNRVNGKLDKAAGVEEVCWHGYLADPVRFYPGSV